MKKRILPDQYGVLEKEPRMCSAEFPILLGPFNSIKEAEDAQVKYGLVSDNHYIDLIKKGKL